MITRTNKRQLILTGIIVTLIFITPLFAEEKTPHLFFFKDRQHNGYTLTYEDWLRMNNPQRVFYINEYVQLLEKRLKKTININDIRMTDIDKFIEDYGRKHGKDVRMTEVIEKMIEKFKGITI